MDKKGYLDFTFKSDVTKNADGLEVVVIEGYASVDTKDRDGDVVVPKGIDTTNFEKNPIILYQHNRNSPAGKAVNFKIDDKGLYVKCEVYKDVNPQAYYAVKSGVVTMFSIGFRGLDGKYDEANDTFYFTKTELFEISLVSIPANQDAKFELVKTPCGDGFCLAGKHLKEFPDIPKANKEEEQSYTKGSDMTEELLKELVAINKELLSAISQLNKEPEVAKEDNVVPEDTAKEVETPFEIKEVTEENFDTLLKLKEELESKLNKFVEENLQGVAE